MSPKFTRDDHTVKLSSIPCFVLALLGCSSETPARPEPAPEPPAPVVVAPPDPLRCELAVTTVRVDAAGGISAPVFVGDGLIVAYQRYGNTEVELLARRASLAGELGPEHVVARSAHVSAPRLVSRGDRAAVTVSTREGTRLVSLDRTGRLDASAPTVTLSAWPEAIAMGPRGFVALPYRADMVERIGLDGSALPTVSLPPLPLMPEPQEELVASGAEVDLVLRRRSTEADAVTIDAHAIRGDATVARHESIGDDAGASVAAGPSGFLVVVSAPGGAMNDLALHFFDPRGAPRGRVVHLAGDPNGVRRYARAAPLGDSWLVSFWDGTGPSLLRIDGEGRELAPVLPLRSGEERGGHTDARMAARDGVIAITWDVTGPTYGHGGPDEQPPHPGPRLMIARCAR